jgi:hypothetical protein
VKEPPTTSHCGFDMLSSLDNSQYHCNEVFVFISLSTALYRAALPNIEPLGSTFVRENSTKVSMILGSFPNRKKS